MSEDCELTGYLFVEQEKYYNGPTASVSRLAIQKDMSKLGAFVLGNSFLADFESGFEDSSTDLAARISYRVGRLFIYFFWYCGVEQRNTLIWTNDFSFN